MGIFKATCAISQLPINYKEPVRVIFLKMDAKNSRNPHAVIMGSSSANTIYNPCLLSVKGKSDYYGGIILEEKHEHSELVIDFFKKQFKKEVIENIHSDILSIL